MIAGNPTRYALTRLNCILLFAVFMIVAAVMAVPFHSVRSSSLPASGSSQVNAPSGASTRVSKFGFHPASNSSLAPLSAFPPLAPVPQSSSESINTYDGATCTIPKTDFNLGDTVCARATGVPVTIFSWHVSWVDTVGFVRQSDTAIANDQATYTYTLPSTTTSVVNGQTVDNRGTWRVNLTRFSGAIRQTASFTVHEPTQPVSDVFVQKFQRDPNSVARAGGNIAFIIAVGNLGPDPAAAVHLVDSAPAGSTLVSFTQQSGPTCVAVEEGVPADCIIAALTNGERSEFTVIYGLDSGTAPGTVLTTSDTVSSTTEDPNPSNNTSSAQFQTEAASGTGTCTLTCPTPITTEANTTEGGQRGSHVTYAEPAASGDCGSVSSTPASGSFFPVGTTTVHATSETGGGTCTFTVTVEDNGSAVNISCPADKTANADSNCSAIVNVGTATATGDNVTIIGSRTDGKPMYNCDANGTNCTRRSSDDPFAAGVTTITWIAYAHDAPGPYADAEDEEGHRTGSASCNQTVTVSDVTPPTITATDQTASADANCQAAVPDYSNSASDNCACASSDTSESCQDRERIVVTQDPAAGTMVGLGPHTIHLTATDQANNTSTKDVTFTVNDTTAPTINCPANITTDTDPGLCSAVVVTGTATATDNCDSTPTITGTRSDNQPLIALYPKGTTTITWRATDDAGNYSECTQTVTVVDHQPPTITFNGQTPSMWPPNHAYNTFTAANFISSVSDNCDTLSISNVDIISATSDEVENSNGSGNTLNDIVIAANCKSIQLRAERENSGNGRVYTITFRLRDTSGNTTTGTAKVYSPKNEGETPVDDGPHYSVTGTCP